MKWTGLIVAIFAIAMAIITTNKDLKMRSLMQDVHAARSTYYRSQCILRGKQIICTDLLPYVLENYRDERDIQFVAAMIGSCRTGEDNQILWDTAISHAPGEQIRIICMAHLLSRDRFEVWGEITPTDIDMLALSMPVHIVHWKQLLLKYSGRPMRILRRDTYPERHKFRALFRECIEKYKADETRKMMNEKGPSSHAKI